MRKQVSLFGWIFIGCYIVLGVAFLAYSYTQVDLGLTLTHASIWRSIQTWFQHIGYFNRPLSTGIFLTLLAGMFLLYGFALRIFAVKKMGTRELWGMVIAVVATMVLSYPAFSYDFFNYLFTAKTVLVYHKNPYGVTPLQFAGVDPWLSFMHWTHQASAYTPLWILATLPPFLLGFGFFLPLIWNLKLLIAASYVLTIVGIGKVLEQDDPERKTLGMAVLAFNPLIIIECIISPHNDILMMALAVWAIVVYRNKKKWTSWILLSLSIAMKMMTLCLIPAFFTGWKRRIALVGMIAGFIAVLFQREVLSWYWVWIVPFIALVPDITALLIINVGVSLGLLLRYAPFLYFGHWNDPVFMIKEWGTWVPISVSVLIAIGMVISKKIHTSKTRA